MTQSPKYGILQANYIEKPFPDSYQSEQAEKATKEIEHLGFRVINGGYEFAFVDADDLTSSRHSQGEILSSGLLISLFSTIERGIVFWSSKIEFDFSEYHHGIQRNLSPSNWANMFNKKMPAVIQKKSGEIFHGALEPFIETGTEGVIWSIAKYGFDGYDALETINSGDKLTVYSKVLNGKIDWQGIVKFSKKFDVAKPVSNEKFALKVIRDSLHLKSEAWLKLSFQNRPCKIIASKN